MKSPKSKQDLIETVYKQIELDIHCDEVDNLQVLCTTCHDFKTKNEKYGSTS
jgi:hypothetical protein